ncbi:CCR4-NOT transcription complex subunit 2 [Halotydeus destructor]|nr:CCR4-NOT transcription complex subunit 2 [Halotydeus destructor]
MLGPTRRVSLMNPLSLGQGNSSNRSLTPPAVGQQPSPNSSFLAGLSSRLVGSRNQTFPSSRGPLDIFDSANIMGPSAPGGSGFAGFRGSNQANFGIPTSSGPPSTFDINEFPSLGNAGIGHTLSGGNAPGSNRPNYVGQVVKDIGPVSHDYPKSSFNMDEMDFPALPGSGSSREQMNENSFTHGLTNNYQLRRPSISDGLSSGDGSSSSLTNKSSKRGIQTTKEGRVSNIPMGMVTDQFGMIGLLTFIRAAETDQNLVSLALGTDLTTLKLDLNSSDNLYSTFPGPWSDQPLKPHEIDYPVPSEYLIYNQIRDKLAPIKLGRYGDDTLFYLFYSFPCDLVQIAAAAELYARDWRYHKDEKLWITRAPGMPPIEKTQTYERGTYYFFDHMNWRRVAKEFHLDYDRLETRPATANYNQNSMNSTSLMAS